MPLPWSKVIPNDWSEHHRLTATRAQTGECTITRPAAGPGPIDPDTGQHTIPAATTVYTGSCRVQSALEPDLRAMFAGEQVALRRYLVVIQWDAAVVERGDLVTITTADDAQLVGRILRVTEVERGTEQWERDLTCEDQQADGG